MPARKTPERVCVVVGRQSWTPFIGSCRSKEHGHLSGQKAEQMVEQMSAEWIQETWKDAKGKEHKTRRPAIRLTGKKRWKGKVSGKGDGTGRTMKVMQLVSN